MIMHLPSPLYISPIPELVPTLEPIMHTIYLTKLLHLYRKGHFAYFSNKCVISRPAATGNLILYSSRFGIYI